MADQILANRYTVYLDTDRLHDGPYVASMLAELGNLNRPTQLLLLSAAANLLRGMDMDVEASA